MDQKLISRFMMHLRELISVVPFNLISNCQSDLIFNTKLIRWWKLEIVKMKIRYRWLKCLREMSMMKMILSGRNSQ